MIIMKLDYIFACLLIFLFCERYKLKILFSTYFLVHTCWVNVSSFKQKMQKKNQTSFVKKLNVFPQKSIIFLQIL